MKHICTIFSFIPSVFVIIGLLYSETLQSQTSNAEVFTMPAEFEKHEAIWMAWKKFPDAAAFKNETVFLVLKALTPYVPVNLLIEHDSVSTMLHEEFKKRGIDKSRVQMFAYGSDPYRNLRDPGPVFLKSNKGNLMIADMKWNFYGSASNNSSPGVKRVDTVDQYVARKLNLPIRTSTLVSEGGAREFNGSGTMMVVEYTEMHRNQRWTRDSIEK